MNVNASPPSHPLDERLTRYALVPWTVGDHFSNGAVSPLVSSHSRLGKVSAVFPPPLRLLLHRSVATSSLSRRPFALPYLPLARVSSRPPVCRRSLGPPRQRRGSAMARPTDILHHRIPRRAGAPPWQLAVTPPHRYSSRVDGRNGPLSSQGVLAPYPPGRARHPIPNNNRRTAQLHVKCLLFRFRGPRTRCARARDGCAACVAGTRCRRMNAPVYAAHYAAAAMGNRR